jgi:hypothetical protein
MVNIACRDNRHKPRVGGTHLNDFVSDALDSNYYSYFACSDCCFHIELCICRDEPSAFVAAREAA